MPASGKNKCSLTSSGILSCVTYCNMRIKHLLLLNVNCQCENAAWLLLELIHWGSILCDRLFQAAAANPVHNNVLGNKSTN